MATKRQRKPPQHPDFPERLGVSVDDRCEDGTPILMTGQAKADRFANGETVAIYRLVRITKAEHKRVCRFAPIKTRKRKEPKQ